MKFLYVCADQGIPILGAKGASVHVREFVTALMKQGHSVELICARRGDGNEAGDLSITEIKAERDAIRRDDYWGWLSAVNPSFDLRRQTLPASDELLQAELKKLIYNPQLGRALTRVIPEMQPDVIYERYSLFTLAPTMAAHKYGLPHILEVNAPLIRERQASMGMRLPDLAQQIEDEVMSRADRVFAVSGNLAAYVVERGAKPSRVRVIPNGVDLEKFHSRPGDAGDKSDTLRRLGLPKELAQGIVVGFAGSLKPWHGVDVLLQALARARGFNSNLALLIVGEGPELGKLVSEASALGLSAHVHFTGAVAHRLVPQYIALMDIAAAPYRFQSDFYFSPLKIVEYLAAGKPVVSTDQGQIRDLIEHERTGLVCEPESADSLADALVRLANDAPLRRKLGRNAAALAQDHSWSHVARRVAAIAQGLATASQPDAARAVAQVGGGL